jgi:chemotaxis signal transduction protein
VSLHVHIRAGAENYALPVSTVREVAELGEVSTLPGAPAGVLGVRNVHGEVVPVLDLAELLGVAAGGEPGRIVIAEDSGRTVGLAVEGVIGVEEIEGASEEVHSRHLSGAALIDGSLIGIVDLPGLLDSIQEDLPQ